MNLFPNGRYLMSSPKGVYDVCYRINPWMEPEKKNVDTVLAYEQWNQLRDTVARLGARTDIIKIHNADGVFAGNAGFVYNNHFVLNTFRHPERQVEEPYWLNWAREVMHPEKDEKMFDKIHIINNVPFEGRGDALRADIDDLIMCGYGFRSDVEAPTILQDLLETQVIPVELAIESFYHLDTVFCPLQGEFALFYPSGVKDPSIIRKNFDTIEVPEADALKFACNSILIDDVVVIPEGCDETCDLLKKKGYKTCPVPMTEFIKSGGACHCLVLRYF